MKHEEIEIKIAIADVPAIREGLTRAGFLERRPRTYESNRIYDTADRSLRASGSLIRLREYGGEVILTFKGPATADVYKRREEIDCGVASAELIGQILDRLGYEPVFQYEKYRTEFTRGGENGIVVLDETPIGDFIEIEGEPWWIDKAAADLGYSHQDFLTASYGALYFEYCRMWKISARNMTFDSTKFPVGRVL